jgi:hypothetical protein
MTEHALPPVNGNGEHATVRLSDYLLAVRAGDTALAQERDRRYAEVKAAEEKALKVKEKADEVALGLQRDYQTYKDLKANELREQIASERGLYVTRDELKPVIDFVTGAQRVDTVKRLDSAQLVQVIALLVVAAGVIFAIVKG